jgi:hypothetical protein
MAGAVDLRTRFGGLRQVQLVQNRLLAEDDSLGIATVAVDWIETGADGQTGEYSGMIFTDTGPYLWRWDSWRISQVLPTPPAAPPPPSLGGSGGSGGGGGDGDGG